jgi:hypothetical protein
MRLRIYIGEPMRPCLIAMLFPATVAEMVS